MLWGAGGLGQAGSVCSAEGDVRPNCSDSCQGSGSGLELGAGPRFECQVCALLAV